MEVDQKIKVNNDRPEIGIHQTPILRNIILLLVTHTLGPLGVYMLLTGQMMWQSFAFSLFPTSDNEIINYHVLSSNVDFFYSYLTGFGTTAGSHRLWAHQSYKAKTPLKILLILSQAAMGQESMLYWVMDHRVHHKYTETEADPYNAKRGFWFSHVGWLLQKKTDAVLSKLKTIDISDLEKDPIVMFQHKYYVPIAISLLYIIPIYICCTFWGDTVLNAFILANVKYFFHLNFTFSVNSAAHLWGYKPYDKNIGPVENKVVSVLALGEGWHNYHHVFPWDYKTSELGSYGFNWSTAYIDLFAWIGWAYDLKTVSKPMVEKRAARTGDGTWDLLSNHDMDHHHENAKWGWGDKDISQEDLDVTRILCASKDL